MDPPRKVPADTSNQDNTYPFTDMPDDEAIDRQTEANSDIDWNSVGMEQMNPRQQKIQTHALDNPLA